MNLPIPTPHPKSLGAGSPDLVTGASGQTICLVNDNNMFKADDEVWVLFVGNPANVTANGATISGLRNLAIPTGCVSTAQTAAATLVQSNTFTDPLATLPAAPFPLAFISGANARTQVQVTGFDSATGSFTVASDPTLLTPTWPLAAQAIGDQFVIGAYSQALSTLHQTGTTESPLSGCSPKVYTVTAQSLDAGVVYISYGQLTYLGAAPAITASCVAFQTVELTTGTGGGATTADLTVIDYFGIPLQIQSVNQADNSVADTRTFYFKQSTITADLQALGATPNQDGALYLGPGQVAAANQGDPSPFPSFHNYLQSLTAAFPVCGTSNYGAPNPAIVYGITVVGNYQSSYNYSAQFSAQGGNFTCVLTPQASGNSFTAPPPYFPSVTDIQKITINLPLATSTNPVGYDSVIYGAVLDASSFSIDLSAAAPALTPTTLSGPFSVTTGASTTVFTASALALLATAQLGGLSVQFISGANSGVTAVIIAVTTAGTATLATALTATPSANDQFQILFSVTSAAAQNTICFFGAAPLTGLNFLAPFGIGFVTGQNTGQSVYAVAIDAAGNVTLGAPPSSSPQPLTYVPQAGDLFTISVAPADVFTQLYTNSVFSWVVSDVLAGLNFGFPGGGDTGGSQQWYCGFPQEYPFGLARLQNDGFYNPWAALFYNASDAYGFAFSDRIAPSPLMGTSPATQDFWITVLPQTQIDAPLVTATPSNNAIALSWTPEAGVSYTVTTEPPDVGQTLVNSAQGQAWLTGLAAATPYTILVQGSNDSQTSLVLPVYTCTTGALVPTSGVLPFGMCFTWAGVGNLPAHTNVLLNGSPLSLLGNPAHTISNAALSGNSGNNLYVLDFQDSDTGQSVYQAVVCVNLGVLTSAEPPVSFCVTAPVQVYGSAGTLTIAPPNGPYTVTYGADGPTSPLVLGLDFAPQVRKEYTAVVKA